MRVRFGALFGGVSALTAAGVAGVAAPALAGQPVDDAPRVSILVPAVTSVFDSDIDDRVEAVGAVDVDAAALAPDAAVRLPIDGGRSPIWLKSFDQGVSVADNPQAPGYIQRAKGLGARVIVITDPWNSPAARLADAVLAAEVTSPSPFDSMIPASALTEALIAELVPHIEKEYRAIGTPAARFVTGHSSGGWSSLWLQISYPDYFGGTWSSSPASFAACTGTPRMRP